MYSKSAFRALETTMPKSPRITNNNSKNKRMMECVLKTAFISMQIIQTNCGPRFAYGKWGNEGMPAGEIRRIMENSNPLSRVSSLWIS